LAETVAAIAVVIACSGCSPSRLPSKEGCSFGTIPRGVERLTVDDVWDRINVYDHREVVVTGFYTYGFESAFLWQSRSQSEQRAPHRLVIAERFVPFSMAACKDQELVVAGELVVGPGPFGIAIVPRALYAR
jgi:hypothetical protein